MSKKEVATVIINRNLPEVTNNLVNHIKKYDGLETDIFIIEAGSDHSKLSENYTWHINDDFTIKHGLRYPRGVNLGIKKLYEEGKFESYSSFFFITNDTVLDKKKTIAPLQDIMNSEKKVGILSPCSRDWGEKLLLKEDKVKFFWFIHSHAYFLKKDMIKDLCNLDEDYLELLFDGKNFRGWGTESELIAKAYEKDWASAITSNVWISENDSYLLDSYDLIKTESPSENIMLYLEEGKRWMKEKYGFNSKWDMVFYVKSYYDKFFQNNQNLIKYKI